MLLFHFLYIIKVPDHVIVTVRVIIHLLRTDLFMSFFCKKSLNENKEK